MSRPAIVLCICIVFSIKKLPSINPLHTKHNAALFRLAGDITFFGHFSDCIHIVFY